MAQTGNGGSPEGANSITTTPVSRRLDSFWTRLFAPFRGYHSGVIIDDGTSFFVVGVHNRGGKAVAENENEGKGFGSFAEAVKAFGTGDSGKTYAVTTMKSATFNSADSAGAIAGKLVSDWNSKNLAYPAIPSWFGAPRIGQGVCHSFTHWALERLNVPHPEQATRQSGFYPLNIGWERGGAIYAGE